MTTDLQTQLAQIEQAIAAQESLRGLGVVPEETIAATLAQLRHRQAELQARLADQAVTTQDSTLSGGDQSVVGSQAGRDIITGDTITVYAREGSKVVIGGEDAPVKMTAVARESTLGKYLQHLISRNRYLQLQGIRSGGRLVHIELDQIYITLRATRQRRLEEEQAFLAAEAQLAPGEHHRLTGQQTTTETVSVSVNEALADFKRLVVLGDPGSGKTTLLRYLALCYARDVAEKSDLVSSNLGLTESGHLPILLYLRQIGRFLSAHRPQDDGTEGHTLLLDFLHQSLKNENFKLERDFFEEWLTTGRAVILLDGLDEVADPDLRRRVSRLVEAFCRAYPHCRYVITSRIVGYSGAARLGENFSTTTVRDFNLKEINRFLTNWHRLLAVGQMGPGAAAETHATQQTQQLVQAIEANERIRELAINPLLLTVIAMVHRDRVKLPDRRAELYAEAVDVLLGKWDEARGLTEAEIIPGQIFDTGDRRLMLQSLALHLQEKQQKDIAQDDLRRWLAEQFRLQVNEEKLAVKVVDRFLRVIEERTGLLAARGEGVYAFSHLTFQEYLAALAIAGRDDYLDYSLRHSAEEWWREVILLEAGHLSTQSREKTTRLIQAIADAPNEPEPYHNLVLAAQCLRDVGANRVGPELEREILNRLRADLEVDLLTEVEQRRIQHDQGRANQSIWQKFFRQQREETFNKQQVIREIITRKSIATQALVRAGAGYWSLPYGEPEWVEIPAGEFWMGEDSEAHRINLPRFLIAKTPVTNAQYYLFIKATQNRVPSHWEDNRPPKVLESHPVVNITWSDALAYCSWLSQMTGKPITLPSEAEWEKAARGDQDRRVYPWGDRFEAARCNTEKLGLGDTTPVGIFPNGASPYGVLEMSGNVWEWTRSIYEAYPYDPDDGRENLKAGDDARRVLRGGAFVIEAGFARCAIRYGNLPNFRFRYFGFRVVCCPHFSSSDR